MDNLLGTELKGYELLELIGAGGFGAVYRANQAVVGREVAVKVILPEYASTPMFIRRFESEAQIVARLEHPYIVPLYDYWRDPRGAYLVMRYLKGGSLARLVRHEGALTLERAGIMLNQIASALAVAHADGVVHRDLKPDNILLDETGNYFLSDFGIAKDLGSEGINLTQTGAIIGSPAYLSPEQITGEDITPLSDVYSLGILLHYSLTGEHPFPGKTPTAMLIHQMQDPMPPLQVHRDDIPDALEEVLQRTTAKDPGQRYGSVMELALAFNRALKAEFGSTSQVDQLLSTDAGLIITGLTPADARNPYKGLKAFEEADADEFYGREALTERLISRITPQDETDRGENLLVVVGPSGSGKSSVVKAGVIPQLRNGAIPGNQMVSDSDKWFYVELVPGNHPMEEMEAALLRVAVNPPESLLEQLEADERGLVRAIKRVLPEDDSQLVLVIDQFEEVFTLTETDEERRHFLNSLMRAIQEPRNRLRLIITLRADFYDRPLSYFEFGELVREHTEVVLPLSAQELENAIVRPAQRVGVTLEPGLTSAIVADVREQPGALPLLQYALTQLFERRDGGRLTLQAYADIGGAMGALAKRAEEIYQSLDLEERDAGQQMFLRLVTLGEGQEDTRRRINQSELNSLGHPEAMAQVIGVFGEQRLLTFDNDPHTREPTLEVAHEALIREWHRLRDWLDTAREDLRTQRRLNQATMEWLHSGQDRSFLATGSRLDQFEALKTANRVAMNEEEGIYLDRSISQREEARLREEQRIAREEELEEKSRRQLQMTLTVVSVAAVIALALAILSGFLFRQSQSNLTLARDNEAEALSARSTAVFNADLASVNAAEAEARASEAQAVALAANALNVLDNFRPTLSLGLALESVALEPDLQPVQQALAQTAYAPGAIAQINPQPDVSMLGISFSSDGTEMAAALFNGQVLVINADDHTVRLEIPAAEGEETPILAVDYSPTAPVIASGGVDGVVRLWDAENGKIVHRMEGHTAQVRELAFSPDGRLLVSGGDDTLLNLWDVETGTLIRTIGGETGHPGRIVTVDFSGDGQRVVSGATDTRDENNSIIDDDRTARVWDVESGDLLATLHIPESGWPRAADLSPDGSVALVATYDPNEFGGIVRMWDVESESVVRMFTGHSDVITTLDIAPDGQTFISGSWDRSVRRWEIATGAQIQRFNNHDDRILDVDFSPDGEFIATTSGREPGDGTPFDNSAFFVSLQRRDLIRALRGHEDWLWSVSYSPDNTMLATGSGHLRTAEGDNSVRLWDVTTGEQTAVLAEHTNTVSGVEFNPLSTQVVSVSFDGRAILWDIESQSIIREFLHEGENGLIRVNGVDISPDGVMMLTTTHDGMLHLWNPATGEQLTSIEAHGGPAFRARFSPDGTRIVSGGGDSAVKLWDVDTGEIIHEMTGSSGWINTVNFSPDGSQVVSGANDDLIIWSTETGEEVYRLVGHQGFVYGGAFSPDGRYVVSGATDTTVRVWETRSTQEIRRFLGHTNWVQDIAYSPDGTQVASAAEDNTARVWNIARSTGELVEWAQANRYIPELTCDEREQFNVEPLCDTPTAGDTDSREGR